MNTRYQPARVSTLAFGFVCVVCLLLVIMDIALSWNARDQQLKEMREETTNLAHAAAHHAQATFKVTDTVLFGMVERLEFDGTGILQMQRLHRFLQQQLLEQPHLAGLFVYDEQGNWLTSSQAQVSYNLNNSDRDYFIWHRTHTDRGPHIGKPVISRSTGLWIIPVSRRFNHDDGSFAGVVLASVRLDYFSAFYNSFDIGSAGAMSLVLDNGTLLVRRPFNPANIGSDMRSSLVYQGYRNSDGSGSLIVKSIYDGVTRLNSFQQVEGWPVFVAAAFSRDEILAEWWRHTLFHSLGILVLVSILGLAGTHLVQQINLRARAQQDLLKAHRALENINATLQKMAAQDGLTGLANRRQFDSRLAEEFARAAREQTSLALIMIDVDFFKRYNDLYGHPAGDDCLRAISHAIDDLVHRPGDLAARYGGEEMAVLLPNTDLAGARSLAEKFCAAVRALDMIHAGNPASFVTISAGVHALIPRPDQHTPALVQPADEALYRAKESGRNRVESSASDA
ncbi:sensor domain-containing diguanylate cyclase [Silvimonas iriomotensis]|uniref:diguanylate cyclase n=1 Tax=Silvimonas iriomotensis TaxID=449662 RepID=A0ABQ2P940_9NEIS|nr:sensor domain-containing diguanylate cyclase [Silvimonas iriomotensis]GGP21232.1 sensor domain-containing diguanylate cyclase [Silvimonas iriomotensis]